jgi:magnesium transporter
VFVVIHALGYDEASGAIKRRELNVFLGKGYLVTVHVEPIETVDKVFKEAGRSDAVLSRGPALVAHIIIDRLIDLAYQMVEVFDDDIEEMENRIAAGQTEGLIDWQLRVRRGLLLMKKSIGPQRDVLNELARRDSPLISRQAAMHFRDDYDRLARVYDQVDTNRELVAAAAEAYRSMVSLRINEITLRTNAVIEWLTLFAAIFLPLTFLAGVYGMNFPDQPEYGIAGYYFFLWGVFILIAAFMVAFFLRRGWINVLHKAEKLDFVPDAVEREEHDS